MTGKSRPRTQRSSSRLSARLTRMSPVPRPRTSPDHAIHTTHHAANALPILNCNKPAHSEFHRGGAQPLRSLHFPRSTRLGWRRTRRLIGGSIAGNRSALCRSRANKKIFPNYHHLREDPLRIRTRGKYERSGTSVPQICLPKWAEVVRAAHDVV